MIPEWLSQLNAFAWVASNALVAYIAVLLVIFVVAYYVFFDPNATTAGKYIFRFFVSLFGVIGLIFISLFVDPRLGREWTVYPGDVLWWRPLVRLIAYSYVAFTITSLSILLAFRKWKPSWLRTSLDQEMVKLRGRE